MRKLDLDSVCDYSFSYDYVSEGEEKQTVITFENVDGDYNKPLQFVVNGEGVGESYPTDEYFESCKDFADCGELIAKKFITKCDSDITMNIYMEDSDYYVVTDYVLNKETLEYQREYEETPLTLTLCANRGRNVHMIELTDVDEEKIDELKEAFDNEDIDAVSDFQWDNGPTDTYEVFNLWGDDDEEVVSYEIENEDGETVGEGEHLIAENDAFSYRDEKAVFDVFKPKYLLIHTDVMKRSNATFKVPADFNIENLRFQQLEFINNWKQLPCEDLFGDTIVALGDVYYHGNSLDCYDVSDAGSYGDNHYYLYELGEDGNYVLYGEVE